MWPQRISGAFLYGTPEGHGHIIGALNNRAVRMDGVKAVVDSICVSH